MLAQSGYDPTLPPEPGQLSVRLTANPEGSAWLTQTNPNGLYLYGAKATVKAEPNENYEFVAWENNGAIVSTQAEYSFSVTATTRLTARMRFNPTGNPGEPGNGYYNVIVTSRPDNGGYVSQSGQGIYQKGEAVTLTANPYPDYQFDHWEADRQTISEEATYRFTMPSKHMYLKAVYTWNPVSPDEPGNPEGWLYLENMNPEAGYLSQSGNGVYPFGTTVTLIASPFKGYRFTGWYEEERLLSTTISYQIEIRKGKITIEGRFEKQETPVTPPIVIEAEPESPTEEPHGEVEVNGIVQPGQWIEVNAKPEEGYAFEGWYLNGTFVEEAEKDYLLLIGQDMSSLKAKFKELPFDLEVEGGEKGWTDVSRYRGSTARLVAQLINGFHFIGWYLGERLLSNESVYDFEVTLLRSGALPVITAKYAEGAVGNETIDDTSETRLYLIDGTLTVCPAEAIRRMEVYTFRGEMIDRRGAIAKGTTQRVRIAESTPLLIRIEYENGIIHTRKLR